jgi:hypothetical protein
MNVKPLALLMLALSAVSTLVLLDLLTLTHSSPSHDPAPAIWLAGTTSVLLLLGSLVEQVRK